MLLIAASFFPDRPPLTNGVICVGVMLAGMIYNAVKRRPVFIGKPSPLMEQLAMKKFGFTPERTAVIGEVSLTGEIRPLDRMLSRVNECVRRGYTSIIAPYSSSLKAAGGAEFIFVKNIRDALGKLV